VRVLVGGWVAEFVEDGQSPSPHVWFGSGGYEAADSAFGTGLLGAAIGCLVAAVLSRLLSGRA
jgi:hypothetical protein